MWLLSPRVARLVHQGLVERETALKAVSLGLSRLGGLSQAGRLTLDLWLLLEIWGSGLLQALIKDLCIPSKINQGFVHL